MVARAKALLAVPGLPAAAFLSGLLFLFLPAQAYEGNAPYIHFGLLQILVVLAPLFLLALLLLAAIAAAGGEKTRAASAAVLAGIAAAAWAVATFMSASRGLMDGRAGLQLAYPFHAWMATLAWAFIALAAGLLAWRFPAMARRLFAAMFAVLAAHTAWIAATGDKPWHAAPDFERFATLSSERNVLVILLDAFQADFFEEIVRDEPWIATSFEGFTYFPNTAGNAMTTYLAMPTIHSGARITDGRGINALYQREVVERSFVAGLAASGWDAIAVNPILGRCPRGATCESADLLVHGRDLPLLEAGLLLVNFAAFRAAPHVVKPEIYNEGAWWLPLRLYTDFASTSNQVLDDLGARLRSGNPRPAVRFLHLFSTHGPASFDARCQPVQGAPWDRGSALAQCRCGLSKVVGLLQALKGRSLYDATSIVILADHGSGLPADVASGFVLGAGGSPLLMVKPSGKRGPMATSQRVVGLADVAATVCARTGACKAASGVDVLGSEAHVPDYPFVTYVWDATYYGADEVPFDNRFAVRGPPRSVASWWRETNLPKGVRSLDFSGNDNQRSYGFGWSGFELYDGRWMRWSVGPEADLYLDLAPGRDNALELEVMTHQGNLPQSMLIEVNGVQVGEISVTAAWARHRVVVPAAAVTGRPDRLLFRPRHSNSPYPGEPRRLGVLFGSLAVHPL